MDAGIYMLGMVIILFSLVFASLDVNLNSSMKQDLFDSVRASNQNALFDIQEDYESGKVITTLEMLDAWLMNFAGSEGLAFKDIELCFVKVKTDPPLYLVYAEGHMESYTVITGDAYASYYSSATIITK